MERTEKAEHIVEAAIRRFAHFGVHKTTLTEIADDLGITKQALAYYFPDKQALLEAVEQKIISEFFQLINQHTHAAPNTELALLGMLEVKKSFFDKYAMLMQQVGPEMLANFSRVAESRRKVQASVLAHIAHVLDQGIASGELKAIDTAEVSMVLYETMSAYEHCFVNRQVVPDPQTFSDMCSRQKAVMQLIINGLKAA
jgi:TetR/AcrR family transcriptional repressor of mexJK operon